MTDDSATVISGPPIDPVDAFRAAPLPAWESSGSYGDITYEVAEGIAKITICRPERRNAFRPQTLFELSDAFERARDAGGRGKSGTRSDIRGLATHRGRSRLVHSEERDRGLRQAKPVIRGAGEVRA